MTLVPPPVTDVPNPVVAALLLSASSRMAALGLPHPRPKEIFAATGAKRSQSYALRGRLEELLLQVTRPAGRPVSCVSTEPPSDVVAEVRDFLIAHPGCVTGSRDRRRYSDRFRRFVLDLAAAHSELPRDALAEATTVPLGTLKDWLAGGAHEPVDVTEPPPTHNPAGHPHIQTVLDEWSHWDGDFVPFCEHLQSDCQIPLGRTLIARILRACGVRLGKRRQGRSPDEVALRGQLETFFPHAQWVGDGTAIPVDVDGELHIFNLELDVDAYSGAFVGAHVSGSEDSEAVIATFHDAIAATGRHPLALLLDNKPSNHCPTVDEALGDTLRMRATPFRPQNKAHVEGGFGLLKPTLDGLTLEGDTPRDRAASFLKALVTAASRAINHRPRQDRGGRSRVDLLGDEPSPEDIERARAALTERMREQEQRRRTLAARQDPIVRGIIADAFDRLELDDPDGHMLTAVARYPVEAVVEGIAIFEGRGLAGTLPSEVDARYLLAIVRNIAEEHEAWEIAEALWRGRVDAQDRLTRRLSAQKSEVDRAVDPTHAYLDHALRAPSRHERFFWLNAAADQIRRHPLADHERLFRLAARRIHATRAAVYRDRADATRYLAGKLRPLN